MTAHPIDTEALRRLADAATPGPWRIGEAFDFPASWVAHLSNNGWDDRTTVTSEDTPGHIDQEERDAEFIAAARTAVPALLDALEQAESDRDWNLRSSRLAKEERIKANARAEKAEAERDEWKEVALQERAAALDALEQVKVRDARIKAVLAVFGLEVGDA